METEFEDVMREFASRVEYDSPYSALDIFNGKLAAANMNMSHEDYQVFADTKEQVIKILRVIDAFDPITGRGLAADGSRDPSVLSTEEKAALQAYLGVNEEMLSNSVDRHLIKGVDALGAYLEYAGFSQEFRRDLVDKDAIPVEH